MLLKISDIHILDRIRKDFGNIEELALDIEANGLINPPVVSAGTFELIAGERRIRALEMLGYEEIEVRVMSVKDAEHALNIEISENEVRKDFSRAERIDYAKRLERIEEIKARQRRNDTLRQNSSASVPDLKESSKTADSTDVENFPPRCETEKKDTGKTRDIVAEKLGIGSGRQYEKEKYIVDNKSSLPPDDFANWDEGRLSTNKVFNKIKKLNDSLTDKNRTLEDRNRTLENRNRTLEDEKRTLSVLEAENERLLSELKTLKEKNKMLKPENDISSGVDFTGQIIDQRILIQNFIEDKLAPFLYSPAVERSKNSRVAQDNLRKICDLLEQISQDYRRLISNTKCDIIDLD